MYLYSIIRDTVMAAAITLLNENISDIFNAYAIA